MRLYLFRHAEVEERYQQRYRGGKLDCDLSEQGKRDSERIAAFLVQKNVEIVVTSGMKRTRYAGDLVARQGISHVMDPRLREIEMGAWDGKPEVPQEELTQGLIAGTLFPGGEKLSDVYQRVRVAWTELSTQQLACISIIGHSITNAVLLSLLFKKDFRDVHSPRKSHYHELTVTEGKTAVVRENASV